MIKKNEEGKVRVIMLNVMRAMLIVAIIFSYMNKRSLILIFGVLGLLATFIPLILKKIWDVEIPREIEILTLFFLYGLLFLGDVRGFYSEIWWWDILLNLAASFALGFIGLAVLYFLHEEEVINANPFIIASLAFCFSVAMGAIWEVFEFTIDRFGFILQKSAADTMKDIIANVIGAFFVSSGGYFYMKSGKKNLFSGMIIKLMEKNKKFFKIREKENHAEKVFGLIKNGEHEKLEFKSTLRRNLHTNEIDPRIEHSVLKTISAYMNSNGGTILVGISDKGEILGLETEGFENNDKLGLHLTNLIKHKIGPEYLPYIKYDLVQIDGKTVLKIDCSPSGKYVFIKGENSEEEFYVRNGPSSAKLSGRELIDYIDNKFNSR